MTGLHYVRAQPGEAWHVLDDLTPWLATLCGLPMGTNPRERHADVPGKDSLTCHRCLDIALKRMAPR